MIKIVGVRFKNAGKIYYFDPVELEVEKSDLLSKPIFKFEEFASVESRYKELFYKLTNIDN